MTIEALNRIGELLVGAGLNYQYGRFRYSGSAPSYPYYVGEYDERDDAAEDGSQTTTLTINGWTRGAWLDLEQGKATIRRLFPTIGRTILLEHSGMAVAYARSLPIPTDDAELKRIEITLTIKEWSVN